MSSPRHPAAALAGCVVLGIAQLLFAPVGARAQSAAAGGDDEAPCKTSAQLRPPDPRCHEALDGRPRAPPPTEHETSRALLEAPRLLSRVLFWPLVKLSAFVESHELPGRLEVLTTTDDGLVGVRPELQYATGFIPSLGARVFFRRLPGAGSQLTARFRTAGLDTMLAELGASGPSWLGLSWGARWNRRPDFLFAGNGPLTDADLEAQGREEARFAADDLGTELRWLRPLAGGLSLLLATDLQWRHYSAGGVEGGPSVRQFYGLPPQQCALAGLPANCVDPAQLPGFDEGMRIVHVGAGLGLDLLGPARDDGGARVSVETSMAQGFAGDPSWHVRVSGDLVLASGGLDRTVLFRVRAAMVEALGDAPVPFEELVLPAGAAGMRGYPDGRFRGPSGLVASAEYRWYIAHSTDAALFVDVGTVGGRRFSDLRWDRLFPDFGLGLRLTRSIPRHWLAPAARGLQIAYAPGRGFRLLLSLAGF